MHRAGLIAALATAGLALALRAVGADHVFVGDSVIFPVGDTYYHLRRALVGMHAFPSVLVWDPLLNFPDGGWVPWPPLHDWLLSLLGRLGGGTVRALETAAAWLPPALGALTVLPVYAAGALLGGWRVGVVAGLVFALLPTSILASQVGYADHHCTMAAVGAVWLLAAMASIGPGGRGVQILLIAARLAMLLLWSGSLLYVAIAEGAYLAVETGERRPERLARYGLGLLVSALAIAALVPSLAWKGGGPYTALGLSWLHPLALGALGSTALVAAALERRWPLAAPLGLLRCAAVGAGIGTALLLLPALREAVLQALGFVGKQEPWAARNAEQRPLFGPASASGWATAFAQYGPLGYLLPLLPIAAWWHGRREPSRRASARLLALWIAGFGTLACLQIRYGSDFAAPASLGGALLGFAIVRAAARRWPALGARWVAAGLALFGLGPLLANPVWTWAVGNSGRVAGRDAALTTPEGSLYRFAQSVRELTPETAAFADPSQRAEYAVLCPPAIGHVIHYVGQRATPADNFGPYAGSRWFEDVRRFYGRSGDGPAFALARAVGARYVVTMDFGETLPGTLERRLHVEDGLAVGDAPAWSHFRLIHEGPRGGVPLTALFSGARRRVAPYKLYEVVPGALLETRALPGTPMSAEVTVRTSAGRSFEYRARGVANANGVARVRVPYPTDGAAPTRTLGAYLVQVGAERYELEVPEEAVRSGAAIPVAE